MGIQRSIKKNDLDAAQEKGEDKETKCKGKLMELKSQDKLMIGKENSMQGLDKLEISQLKSIKFNNCSNSKVGHEFHIQNLTIINPREDKKEPQQTSEEGCLHKIKHRFRDKTFRRRSTFIIPLGLVIICLSIILPLKLKISENKTEKPPVSTTEMTKPTEWPTKPTVDPEIDWYQERLSWTDEKIQPCPVYVNSTKTIITLDATNTLACFEKIICQQVLLSMTADEWTNQSFINYNYLIGSDGRAYEARGNLCPSDEAFQDSDQTFKIAFIGRYLEDGMSITRQQIQVLQRLLKKLTSDMKTLDLEYNITFECCRNLKPPSSGPGEKAIDYFIEKFDSPHLNYDCVNENPKCNYKAGQ